MPTQYYRKNQSPESRAKKKQAEGNKVRRKYKRNMALSRKLLPGEKEHGDGGLAQAARQVRADHHVVAGQPIAPDPAREEEEHLRHRAGGEDVAQVGLRAGELEDREGERDVREGVADERRRPPEEEEPELPLAEWSAHGEVA